MPGSRFFHRAKTVGGRMPPVLRYSCGPDGRTKTPWPPSGFPRRSRQDAGVDLQRPTSWVEPQDAASMRKPERGHL